MLHGRVTLLNYEDFVDCIVSRHLTFILNFVTNFITNSEDPKKSENPKHNSRQYSCPDCYRNHSYHLPTEYLRHRSRHLYQHLYNLFPSFNLCERRIC